MLNNSEKNQNSNISKLYTHIPFEIEEEGISPDLILEKYKNMSPELICLICL